MTNILIIEDDPSIRENMAEILEYSGYTVLKAENGSAGIESALSALPDLILCDVMMPEMPPRFLNRIETGQAPA